MANSIEQEIGRRRTFAIISHPDAGKTTLTEKFLLYGGAINQAGSVKGKATSKHAVSDWMEIEKERGTKLCQIRIGDLKQSNYTLVRNKQILLQIQELFRFMHQHHSYSTTHSTQLTVSV